MAQLLFYDANHRYELDGEELPSVSAIIRFLSREIYQDAEQYRLDQAAERGTKVHKTLELLDKLGEVEAEASILPYCQAYVSFLHDHTINWDLIEKPLASAELGFAGTLDRAGYLDGRRCIVDLKTTATVKKPLVKAQLNGYELLSRANGRPESVALYCLQLNKDGSYGLYDVAIDDSEFQACLQLHRALEKKHGRMKIA